MRSRRALVTAAAATALAAALACNADPVHTADVAALGGEDPRIPQGPYHRAGQPCTVCHGGEGPASTVFSIAGTVFYGPPVAPVGPVGVNDASVLVQDDSPAAPFTLTTNCVGNFWATPSTYNPQFPVVVTVTGAPEGTTLTEQMPGHIGRDASCASCHEYPASAASPGLVYLDPNPSASSYAGFPDCPVPVSPASIPGLP